MENNKQSGAFGSSLNNLVPDLEADCTGYGTHERLVGPFRGIGDESNVITIREDLIYNLPLSTDEQRRRIANGWGRLHPNGTRLTYVGASDPWTGLGGWESVEHTYLIVGREG